MAPDNILRIFKIRRQRLAAFFNRIPVLFLLNLISKIIIIE